jgi:hypothetical protein
VIAAFPRPRGGSVQPHLYSLLVASPRLISVR